MVCKGAFAVVEFGVDEDLVVLVDEILNRKKKGAEQRNHRRNEAVKEDHDIDHLNKRNMKADLPNRIVLLAYSLLHGKGEVVFYLIF